MFQMPEQVRESVKALFIANWGAVPVAFVCLLYFTIMIVTRWRMIADPARRFLLARLDEIHAWLDGFDSNDSTTTSSVAAARALLNKARTEVQDPGPMYYVMWSGSRELAAWKMVHSIECLLAPYWPADQVSARLETARADLQRSDASDAIELVKAIDIALGDENAKPEARKYLLQRALEIVYDDSDVGFAALSNRDNKTMWLVQVAIMTIITAAAVLGHPAYLLVGAIGGAVSRMSRMRRDAADAKPTDYGASWSSLFLSPLAGALAGWAGIFLLQLAVKLHILGTALSVSWDDYGKDSVTLGFAFAFGFSERLLDGLVGQIDGKASPPETAAPKKPASDKPASDKPADDEAGEKRITQP